MHVSDWPGVNVTGAHVPNVAFGSVIPTDVSVTFPEFVATTE